MVNAASSAVLLLMSEVNLLGENTPGYGENVESGEISRIVKCLYW